MKLTNEQIAALVAQGLGVGSKTWAIRERLKAMGCVWDQGTKQWVAVSKDMHRAACALAKSAAPPLGGVATADLANELRERGISVSNGPTPLDKVEDFELLK